MAKIAFLGTSDHGDLNPVIGVLQELRDAGHELHVYGYRESSGYLAECGLDVTCYEDVLGPGAPRSPLERYDPQDLARGSTVDKPADRRAFFTALTAEVLGNVEGYRRILNDLEPDCVIHDLMFPGPRYAAESLGIPLVTSGTMAISPKAWLQVPDKEVAAKVGADFEVLREATAPLLGLRQRLGLGGTAIPVDVFNVSRDLILSYTSELFQGDYDTQRPYRFVGPCPRSHQQPAVGPDVAELTAVPGEGPLVLVWLGAQADPARVRAFAEGLAAAAAGMAVRFILATGPALSPDSLDGLPVSVRAVESVPQQELIPQVDAVVCQGGFITVHDALFAAKPTWALMMDNDQFLIGRALADSGAGIATPLRDGRIPVAEVRKNIEILLQDEEMARAAKRVRDSLLAAGGRPAARAAIEQLIADRPGRSGGS